MVYLQLAWKSIANRRLATALTMLSIALSAMLLVGVENLRRGARSSFQGVIRGVDLVVGAPGSPLNLTLYSVFHMGNATASIPYSALQSMRRHPAVAAVIPISLGDSHRGFRVIATDQQLYQHYRHHDDQSLRFAGGRAPEGIFECALGSMVAERLGYKLGQKVVIAHGVSAISLQKHDDKPFHVVGILEPTGTPLDRSLFISLEGMEAIHIDWQSGAPPLPGEERRAESLRSEELQPREITAMFVKARARMDALRLQREINGNRQQPMLAALPGAALAELWDMIGYAETALSAVSAVVAAVGLSGMLMSIYTTLNERRREIAILRALGAGPRRIALLFVLESGALSLAGSIAGLALYYALLLALRPLAESKLGLFLPLAPPGALEWMYLGAISLGGALLGLLPAYRAYRNALADGLSVRL
ncbi:MAG: ABC transporter permease [Leptospirales bacterium]|nr:ABC transporter permease [Leptospirales bacterium]